MVQGIYFGQHKTVIQLFPKDIQIALPEEFTNPFRYHPHPLVITAAKATIEKIKESDLHTSFSEGKMIGILIVRDSSDNIGYLCGYSGNVGGRNDIEGFVPPIYDLLDPDGYFKKGEQELNELNSHIRAIEFSPEITSLKQLIYRCRADMENEISSMKLDIAEAKAKRETTRKETTDPVILEELTKESQFQKAQLHRLKTEWKDKIQKLESRLLYIEDEIRQMKRLRAEKSEELQKWIFRQYIVTNSEGQTVSISEIFESEGLIPPGGTGECAAPKLLNYAFTHELHPLAMGEFWYGKSPETAVRTHGHFYPSCTSKCGPLLKFMIQGLKISGLFNDGDYHKQPVIIYEDSHIIGISKPSGMPSVPGLDGKESALEWINHKYSSRLHAVHRLDMDTSGVIVFTKDEKTAIDLRKQFEEHSIKKTYRARLDHIQESQIAVQKTFRKGETGEIVLPLSPDYDERPRQKIDHTRGKTSITEYRIIDIMPDGSIDIEFYPITGRTHQLRVHAAHILGLGHPIMGDMLYGGSSSSRLHLHARSITFTHPGTGMQVFIETDINSWYDA